MNKIKVGDIVSVNFNSSQLTLCNKARVEAIPQCQGDSWIFYDVDSHQLHYVSEGCTITLFDPIMTTENNSNEEIKEACEIAWLDTGECLETGSYVLNRLFAVGDIRIIHRNKYKVVSCTMTEGKMGGALIETILTKIGAL